MFYQIEYYPDLNIFFCLFSYTGRTARAGRQGWAITLVENNKVRIFKSMLKEAGKDTDLAEETVETSEKDLKSYQDSLEKAQNDIQAEKQQHNQKKKPFQKSKHDKKKK